MIIYVYHLVFIALITIIVLNIMYYFPKYTKKMAKFAAYPTKATIRWICSEE